MMDAHTKSMILIKIWIVFDIGSIQNDTNN
jgi:hypothetical protein